MNRVITAQPRKIEPKESFDDRVDTLFTELELAIEWDRPSILLAVYSSEFIRADAEVVFKKMLQNIGQSITPYRVTDEDNADIPLHLSNYPDKATTVFFVSGLQWGGGNDGRNAYRALNIRREYFVDSCVRAVFWITKKEAIALANYAPDFWAFRHRVVEFIELPELDRIAPLPHDLAWRNLSNHRFRRYDTLISESKRAIKLNPQSPIPHNQLANVYAALGRFNDAIIEFQQAVNLDPEWATPHNNLGEVYRALGCYEEAIAEYHNAIELDPNFVAAHSSLAACYNKSGRKAEYDEQNKIARDLQKKPERRFNGWQFVFVGIVVLLMIIVLIQYTPKLLDFSMKNLLQSVLDSSEFIIVIIGLLAAIAGAFFEFFGFRSYRQQRRTQRLLEKSFGSELYGPETIERSTRYYIPPNCSSVDPAQEAEMRQVVATEEKLFEAVDKYLAQDNPHRHLLLLADSGMGKSSFVLNYYARNQRLPKRRQQRLAVVPLGIPDADNYIAQISDPQNTVIFLDAFDEDTRAIKDHRQRLLELMQACRKFKRVLITCRTQFFPRAEEIPRETGIARVGPRKAGEPAVYEFWKLYLSPLDDDQVEAFLRKRYPLWMWGKRKQAAELVKKIPLFSVRPMLLAYIPDLLESGVTIDYSFQLYEVLVEKWLERESAWVPPDALRQFSEKLAVDLYANRQRRGAERIPRTNLAGLAKEWNIPLDDWQLSGRSLLNRDAEGNYKFAHRSIMEYLFVKRLTDGDEACRRVVRTDQMNAFLLEMIRHRRAAPFDTKTTDLSQLLLSLRSDPSLSLKIDDVNLMLKRFNYFDKQRHSEGAGILHLYELRERDRVKLVVDYTNDLIWQQSGSLNSMTLKDAEAYIFQLNVQKHGGYRDWRLPTLEEAMSLIEPKEYGKLYIGPIFDRTQQRIWTADKESTGEAWVVFFERGTCGHSARAFNFVRAVR